MKRILITVLTAIIGTSLVFAQTAMRTNLRDATYEGSQTGFGVLPATDPYLGSVTVEKSLPANMVDWVLVELRASADSTTVASVPGCLLADGSVTDTTGTNGLTFEGLESSTSYFIVVRHRNHLSIMSNEAVQIDGTNGEDEFDFTAGNGYGGILAMKQIGSDYAMVAADGDGNDYVQTNDKNGVWMWKPDFQVIKLRIII
ncbi:MAG: hypothetical protein U5N56_11720 [Candidatus Marinimicrobia bacterium]|nr:hypothetical protein [Candidatus Neomarinimicrobiota bacterium]